MTAAADSSVSCLLPLPPPYLAAGKVTVGLTSHWPCVTDLSRSSTFVFKAYVREMSTPPTFLRGMLLFVFAKYLPEGVRRTVMSVSVLLYVCPLACLENHIGKPTDFLCTLIVTLWLRGSVLLWRRYGILRISGFVDDVMFSHNRFYGVSCARL